MLHIVTDGAADMPPEWAEEYSIHTIPINIQFGEKTYLQFIDLDFESFYQKVAETKMVPKTAQPSPHQFVEYYKSIAQEGDTILSIHVTSKLSGTYASAVIAAEELKDQYKIITVDSAGGSMGLGFMCREARKMEQAGKSVDDILAYIENTKAKVQIILTLDTLEYARMSGRVGALSAALASALNVKPIAVLKDGIIEMVGKVRTRKAALKRVIEMGQEAYSDQPVFLSVVHAHDLESGKKLLAEAESLFNVKDTIITDLSVSLATNFGPGTVGLVLYPAE
ncbi:MAG: DegV family protein [Anaerolineae bacterium]|jgi:DegV family protein with EDD domain|nr:DegV family protein [Anaerolineae bacterium]MBT7070762.1 DegV family protein [Anaerolineae bacterium]MBT7324727.1 DegV family protein [Anaerolineae bacterium]